MVTRLRFFRPYLTKCGTAAIWSELMRIKMKVGIEAKTIRGVESWTFIYIALGFALSIEGTLLQMIEPLRFPYNIMAYLAVMAATFWLFILNGWFQNKLIGAKNRYESKAR